MVSLCVCVVCRLLYIFAFLLPFSLSSLGFRFHRLPGIFLEAMASFRAVIMHSIVYVSENVLCKN